MAILSAFAIITDTDGRVLLCHRRDRDLWNLPGGAVEANESPWDAVVREVREEVCLQVEVARLAGIYFKHHEDETSFLFHCVVVGGQAGLTDEADAIDWFAPGELPPNTSERQKERISDFHRSGGKLVLADQGTPWGRRTNREAVGARIVSLSD